MEFNQLGSFGSFGCKVIAFISGLPPFFSDLIQSLIGTTDGQTIDDSLAIVAPEPTATSVPVVKFDGVSDYAYVTLEIPRPNPDSVIVTLDFKLGVQTALAPLFYIRGLTVSNWFNMAWYGTNGTFLFQQADGSDPTARETAVIALDETIWHTLVSEITVGATTGSIVLTLDGEEIYRLENIAIDASETLQLQLANYGNGIYDYGKGEFTTRLYNFKSIESGSVATEVNCTFSEGTGFDCWNTVEDANNITLVPAVSGEDVMRTTDDESPSIALRDGYTRYAHFNGVDQQLEPIVNGLGWYSTLEFEIYVTGFSNQTVMANGLSIARALQLNNVGAVTTAIQLSNPFSTSEYIARATIPKGWHTIKLEWGPRDGQIDGYRFYIDDVEETIAGYASLDRDQRILDSFYFFRGGISYVKTSVTFIGGERSLFSDDSPIATGFLIKDGRWSGSIYAAGEPQPVYDFGTNELQVVGGLDLRGKVPDFDGGYVHNQASAGMIQNSPDIVDFVILEYQQVPPDGPWEVLAYCPKIGPLEYQETGGLGWEIAYVTDRWRIKQDTGTTIYAEVVGETPVPPYNFDTNGSLNWRVSKGYDGSFWADDDGEYVERGWDDLIRHTSAAENAFAVYNKNAAGNCQITQLLQYTLAKQFVEAEIPELAAYQGDSGCEPLITYAVLTNGDSVRTTRGSLVIITQG